MTYLYTLNTKLFLKRRATTADRHYYYSVVEGTPFTVVVALQEKHFGYRVKIPERFQNINTTSNYYVKNQNNE